MKKIYFTFLFIAGALQISNAQLSLTKAFNEPVVGNVHNVQRYDSTTAIAKNMGLGQSWNFNSFLQQSNYSSSTFTTVASTPSAAIFPGSTLAEDEGGGNYTFYKISATNYEVSGLQFPGTPLNFSNTAVFAVWPINFGYSLTDGFGGSTTTSTITTSIAGSINVSATGNGTVTMPGGLVLTNCSQVITSISFVLAQNTATQSQVQKEYNYYHSSNKFPVLTIKYQSQTSGTTTSNSYEINVNTAVVAGITANQLNNEFSVFPNPAHESINVSLTNNSNLPVSASLTNMLGQVVITENLGNTSLIRSNINISTLPKGLYFMNVKVGEATSLKKVVIE
jgi:hypothetical protein